MDGTTRGVPFAPLAGCRRRLTLAALREHPDGLTPSDLAARVAASLRDRRPETDVDRRRLRLSLRHTHLPALADAGLTREVDGDRVAAADHPALRDPGVRDLLDDPSPRVDALFDALAARRRRRLLAVLRTDGPADPRTLARAVAAREADRPRTSVPEADAKRVHVSLRHRHLPKLDDAGLIERDPDGAVAFDGHPDLRSRWLRDELDPVACAGGG